jgi:two-component system sensor histidine kinase/response regulator
VSVAAKIPLHVAALGNSDVLDTLDMLVPALGYTFSGIEQPDSFLEELETASADVVFVDLALNSQFQPPLIHTLRQNPAFQSLFIIGVSDFHEDKDLDVARGIKEGADDIIFSEKLPLLLAVRLKSVAEKKLLRENEQRFIQEIEDQNHELLVLNDLKNKFVGMVAHDLRNPLVSIRGLSNMMTADDTLGLEDHVMYGGMIETTSEKMLKLINDVLDVSVIESGELKLEKADHSLRDLLLERIEILTIAARKKDIKICFDGGKECRAFFDCDRVEQVADNLISNAVKFSPLASTVYVRLIDDEQHAGFSVKDEGPGLSESDKSQMFGHFQKLSAQPTGGESSTGLGLSIVKKIVQAHAGVIEVESTLGEGALFIVQFPRQSASSADDQ